MLIAVSPEPNRTIESIIGAFTTDPWMRTLHDKLLHQGRNGVEMISAKDFE